MVELGGLENRHAEFAGRGIRIVAISGDDLNDSSKTQAKFPHLLIASDPDQKTAKAFAVIHPHMAPGGGDTNAPTTFLVDQAGVVRWLYRPDIFFVRLTADELLAAIDKALPRK